MDKIHVFYTKNLDFFNFLWAPFEVCSHIWGTKVQILVSPEVLLVVEFLESSDAIIRQVTIPLFSSMHGNEFRNVSEIFLNLQSASGLFYAQIFGFFWSQIYRQSSIHPGNWIYLASFLSITPQNWKKLWLNWKWIEDPIFEFENLQFFRG